MANVKISELNELTQVDDDDLLVVVDTSANETKKIRAENVGTGSGGDSTPLGTIEAYSGNTAPNGYLMCDGSAISRNAYADLFAVIGTTYGSGDGSTTFNLPNLKGRTIVMRNPNDTDFDTLGEAGGNKEHKHLTALGFDNNYLYGYAGNDTNPAYGSSVVYNIKRNTLTGFLQTDNEPVRLAQTDNASSLQPYIVLNYIIKAFKVSSTPATSQVVNAYSESTNNVYSCDYVNKFGKLLWSGSWTSGSITVNGSTNYSVFIVFILGTVACLGTRNYGGAVIGKYGTYSYEQYTYRVIGSGNTWTIDSENVGGSDGTQNVAITAIYGLF